MSHTQVTHTDPAASDLTIFMDIQQGRSSNTDFVLFVFSITLMSLCCISLWLYCCCTFLEHVVQCTIYVPLMQPPYVPLQSALAVPGTGVLGCPGPPVTHLPACNGFKWCFRIISVCDGSTDRPEGNQCLHGWHSLSCYVCQFNICLRHSPCCCQGLDVTVIMT